MATIGFIGLGNMGLPMARNLLKAGHAVRGFDLVAGARRCGRGGRRHGCRGTDKAVAGAELVITMLPEGRHVRAVYLGEGGVLAAADGTARC